jgi:hypothetical protein
MLHGKVAPKPPRDADVVLSVQLIKGRANAFREGGLPNAV